MKATSINHNPAYGKFDKHTVRKVLLLDYLDKNNEGSIKVEVLAVDMYGEKTYRRFPTKVRCKESNWDKHKQEVKSKDSNANKKNEEIEKLFSKVKNKILALKNPQQAYGNWGGNTDKDLEALKVLFPQAQEHKKTLTEYIDDYIQYRKSVNTPQGTLKEFVSLKNRLNAFEIHSKRRYYFDDINMTFSDNLNAWMKNLMITKNKVLEHKYQEGTIEKTFTILRTVLNHFNERKDELNIELSNKFQSRNFKKGKKSINDPHPISRTEFDILRKHKFDNSSLELTKQRFLFQCGTGMRFSDMFLITRKNIINNCIVFYPVKTIHKKDNEVEVPIMPMILTILESVGYNMSKLGISNQKYNASLKLMFAELNTKYDTIEFDEYTTHDGRDTFISYALEAGCDVPTLLKIVGQSSYDVMKRYFKSTPEKRIAMMNQISEFK